MYLINVFLVLVFIAVVTFFIMSEKKNCNTDNATKETNEQAYYKEIVHQKRITNILLTFILFVLLFNAFPAFFEWLYWLNQI